MFPKLNKKIVIIGAILIVLIILALILTILNTNRNQAVKISNPNNDKILFPHLTKDGLSLYYFSQEKNALEKWDLAKNSSQEWLKFNFSNTDDIIYAPNLEMALVHTSDPQNAADAHIWLINLGAQKISNQLNANILNADFSPDSQKIAYHYLDWNSDINYLAISNPNGTNEQKLTDIGSESMNLTWVDQKNILYYNIPFEASTVDLRLISLENKESKILANNYYIGDARLIPDTKNILINLSKKENSLGNLTILDPFAKTFNSLDSTAQINQTAFSSNNLIYAAYDRFNTGETNDLFQTINLATKKVKKLSVKSKDKINVTNLMISNDNKTLYFISENNLYKKSL